MDTPELTVSLRAIPATKTCAKCGQDQSLHDFSPDKQGKLGRRSDCRNCQKLSKRAWRKENPDLSLKSSIKYQELHPEETKQRRRNRYKRNKKKVIAYVTQWRKNNPDKFMMIIHARRARKSNAAINDFTRVQWEIIKKIYNFRCAYCGTKPKKLTQDHIIPLSKGGNHTFSNIVPACRSCNSRKNAGKILCPIQTIFPMWSD